MGTGYLNVASKVGGTGFPTIHMRQKTVTHTDYIGPEVSASATTDPGMGFSHGFGSQSSIKRQSLGFLVGQATLCSAGALKSCIFA